MSVFRLSVAAILLAASGLAQSAIVPQQYDGDVTFCPPAPALCGLFGAEGGMLDLSFDLDVTGAGAITDIAAISAVDIRIVTTGGFLEFVNGNAQDVDIVVDDVGNILSGDLTLQATGLTSGVVLDALINLGPGSLTGADGGPGTIDPGDWEATTQGAFVAAGSGAFNVVPVPAAAWLFGSALGLLGWLRKRAA